MLESYLRILWNRRRATLVAGALVALLAGIALPRLSLNDSPERWMPAGAVQDWARFSDHFNYGDTLVIATHFQRPVRNDDADLLRALRQDLEKIPGVARVIDPSRILDEVDNATLTELMASPDPENDRFALYRGVLFDDPEKWQHDRSVIIFIECQEIDDKTPAGKEQLDNQRRQIVRAVHAALEPYQRDDITFHVIGAIAIQYELENIARHVAFTFVPISVLLTFLALGWGFRSLKAVSIAVAGALWGVTVMLGAVAWIGWSLNVVTVGGPTLMFVIVIATTVHFSHYASEKSSHRSGSRANSSAPSFEDDMGFVRWVAFPCLGAALTTGTGFLMLTFNELSPTRELGVELFVGAVLAFLGAFLMWLILHPFRASSGRYLSVTNLNWLHGRITSHPRIATGLVFFLMMGLGISAMQVTIDADPFAFFHKRSPMAKAFRHISDRQFGLHRLDVLLIPKNPGSSEMKNISQLSSADRDVAWKFQRAIAQRPEVRNLVSTLSLSAEIQQLREKGDGLSQFRAESLEETFHSWLHDHQKQGAIRITFKVDDLGDGFQPLLTAVRKNLPEERFDCVLTGTAANVVVLSENLLGGITRGLSTALLVMAGLCFVWFRSIRLTLIAFLPNVFPVLVVFGLMGLLNIPLNCGSAMVMTISLGIALNDTVHFIVHYLQHREEGLATDEAVKTTFCEIGRPIIMTSLVNCFGFAIFVLSDFRPMFHFGSLVSVAMLAALIGDLILLPNLLRLFDRDAESSTATLAAETAKETNP